MFACTAEMTGTNAVEFPISETGVDDGIMISFGCAAVDGAALSLRVGFQRRELFATLGSLSIDFDGQSLEEVL
jgi:hypothetical protein